MFSSVPPRPRLAGPQLAAVVFFLVSVAAFAVGGVAWLGAQVSQLPISWNPGLVYAAWILWTTSVVFFSAALHVAAAASLWRFVSERI